jgi:hypothetical protein
MHTAQSEIDKPSCAFSAPTAQISQALSYPLEGAENKNPSHSENTTTDGPQQQIKVRLPEKGTPNRVPRIIPHAPATPEALASALSSRWRQPPSPEHPSVNQTTQARNKQLETKAQQHAASFSRTDEFNKQVAPCTKYLPYSKHAST